MQFVFGVVSFILGTALVAVCLYAIPGPMALEQDQTAGSQGHHPH